MDRTAEGEAMGGMGGSVMGVVAGIVLALLAVAAGWWHLRRAPAVLRATTAASPVHGDDSEPVEDAADPAVPVDAADPAVLARDLLGRFHAVALGGKPVVMRPGHAEVVAGTVEVLEHIEARPHYTPRRPNLLPQLMRKVNDPDASGKAIAAIIARDPALAGNLLRYANSALYRVQSKPVESIERAVALVGTDGIRQIIAAVLVQPVMGAGGGVFARFAPVTWEHTLLSAAAAADHAKLVERDDAFAAQLLGLLHGLGATIVTRVVRDQYARQRGLVANASLAAGLLDQWAAPTACRLARKWELSGRIIQALDEQSLEDPAAMSALGRSLRFGRLAGSLALLSRQGRLDPSCALPALAVVEPRSASTPAIWERLRHGVD